MNDSWKLEALDADPVASLGVDARATFIGRTYLHLAGAILAFVCIEAALFMSGFAESISRTLIDSWYLVLVAFMIASWGASRVAHRARTLPAQYAALAAFVAVEALIFLPILYIADNYYSKTSGIGGMGIVGTAAWITLFGFAALTAVAFITRKDFSFLRGVLFWGGICAALAVIGGIFFGYNLGLWFSVAMVAFAGAAILYDTSNVIHHFPEDRYVGAALELFASVALLFWYVLRILMSSRD